MKNELKKSPSIINAGYSSETPGDLYPMYETKVLSNSKEDYITIVTVSIDEDYIPMMGIEIKAGRNFSKNFRSDSVGFIINEEAAKTFGYQSAEDALGKIIESPGFNKSGAIIGVVKNFNFNSLHKKN